MMRNLKIYLRTNKMKINIQIHYTSTYDSKMVQGGSFPVNAYQFKKDPDKEAARVALTWWKLIKKDLSYKVAIVEVTYNLEHDITALVKQLENAPLPNLDLPF